MDRKDARVFFELDQLYKRLNCTLNERLENMRAYPELLETRDDLYTEYITLLNLNGEYENAYNKIMNHHFHPWEGGEGSITAQYKAALIGMAKSAGRKEALELLKRALFYPYNLGEGKLAGCTDNDIYYMLGKVYEEEGDNEKSEQAYKLAARGEFNLSSAKYYNDLPPQMMYYAAKAIEALGKREEASFRFKEFIDYGTEHMDDKIKMDYFAVSLPDFLIFEGDLDKNNKIHCFLMAAFGYMGTGDKKTAYEYVKKGLELDRCHVQLNEILREFM